MNELPIGIFDSGVGGLTVVKEVIKKMPYENIIYFADTYNIPYGDKPPEMIKGFAFSIIEFLLSQKVKAIIMGCNMSSALALDAARKKYKIPIFGLIDTSVSKLASQKHIKRVGIVATRGTINSGAYQKTFYLKNKNIRVFSSACPEFVPLIEEGKINSSYTKKIAYKYLEPLIKNKINCLILGCTHYPFLRGVLKKIVGKNVKIVDPAKIVAKYAKDALEKEGLLNKGNLSPEYRFIASGQTTSLETIGSRFIGMKIEKIERAIWEKGKIKLL